MASIDSIVDVQIDIDTATVSRVGFGTPAILTYHTVFPEAARLYGSLAEMVTDGFATTSREYKMVAAIFAQNPKPGSVVVGRRDNAPLRTITLTPKAPVLASTAYDVVINGETMAFTSDATPTVPEITAGITAAIDGGAQDVNATDGTSDIEVSSADAPGGSATAGVPFEITYDPTLWTINDDTADPGIAADLAAMRLVNDDWYGLACDALGAAEITALATAIEAAPKIYFADCQDSDIVESGSADVASTLKASSLARTAVNYHPDSDPSFSAAWLGGQLPSDPGSITWMFKTLTTVSTYSLTTSQRNEALGKSANTYETIAGVNMTSNGTVASGQFIDVTRFVDWLAARLKENILAVKANVPKVPLTDLGIQLVVNEVHGTLRTGASRGGLDGTQPFNVTYPRASEISATDKANRLLPDVEFSATLAGAVHKTQIRGRVTL